MLNFYHVGYSWVVSLITLCHNSNNYSLKDWSERKLAKVNPAIVGIAAAYWANNAISAQGGVYTKYVSPCFNISFLCKCVVSSSEAVGSILIVLL